MSILRGLRAITVVGSVLLTPLFALAADRTPSMESVEGRPGKLGTEPGISYGVYQLPSGTWVLDCVLARSLPARVKGYLRIEGGGHFKNVAALGEPELKGPISEHSPRRSDWLSSEILANLPRDAREISFDTRSGVCDVSGAATLSGITFEVEGAGRIVWELGSGPDPATRRNGVVTLDPARVFVGKAGAHPTSVPFSTPLRSRIDRCAERYSADILKLAGVTGFGPFRRGSQNVLVILVVDEASRARVQNLVRPTIEGFPVLVEVSGVIRPLQAAFTAFASSPDAPRGSQARIRSCPTAASSRRP